MAVELKPLPPADAIAAYEARRGTLTETFSWQDLFEQEHATQVTVAKSAGFDILKDIDAAMMRALAEGRTLEQFSRQLVPVLQEKGWWGRKLVMDPQTGEMVMATLGTPRRLQIIFDTNMRVSYAAGHWAGFERNKASRPFLRYVCILDDRTRPAHRARHNLVLPVDHPYWDKWAPPCGWNCRCTLQSLSRYEVDQLIAEGEDLKFDPPEDTYRDYLNKRTGEVVRVPDGIDPGWAYNPGKAGWKALQAGKKLIEAPADLGAAAGSLPTFLRRPTAREFPDWFDQAAAGGAIDPAMVVAGVIDPQTLQALRARGIDPVSAAITITQKQVRHMVRAAKQARNQAVSSEILKSMPDMLASPRAILLDLRSGELLYVFDAPGSLRQGKLVVRLNYAEKAKAPGGRQAVVSNSIRTAGLVELRVLTDVNTYVVLSGELM
ncbi:SPP1 gp7 family putative phage head morphogenesis protein [Rhizobium subbaraonis]|uniref:SPP1 gp7 family putative phage head morphogenesis protein n=1 Tax=Rhizobium subbaraonis TaxID=908946 RepID=A0A285UXJ8_9HYPH|nr:phage minor head protein [Rhizobium subbaraonis]SOC46645.1 SPP1 gp7 family putative phage head morphogenesis protein [Rhizobium subbaraonis]